MKTTDEISKLIQNAYDDYSDDVFRFCMLKVSDRDVALDIVQDTYIKTLTYMQKGNEIDNMRAFIYRTCRNLIVDYYRKSKSQSLDTILETGVDVANNDEQQILTRQELQAVFTLFERLDDQYRDVLYFKFVEDLDIVEISDILGISENHVSVRMHRGIKKLREIIE